MTGKVASIKPGQLSTGTRDARNAFELWGLTGGVAAGKSVVAREFAAAGFPVIDADQVAAQLREKGGMAYEPILKRFGTADRAKLREIVFSDPSARKDLEAILHPLIQAETMRLIAEWVAKRDGAGAGARANATASARAEGTSIAGAGPGNSAGTSAGAPLRVIYEAALLVETGRYKSPDFAGLLVVDAPRDLRRQRLMARDRISAEKADQILDAQTSDEERLRAATHVFVNNGSLKDMRSKVQEFIRIRGW